MRASSSDEAVAVEPGGSRGDGEPRFRPLEDRILAILRDDMFREVPDAEADLFDTGVLDSLTLVDLLVRIEEQLGVQLSLQDFEIETFATVEAIARAVGQEEPEARTA